MLIPVSTFPAAFHVCEYCISHTTALDFQSDCCLHLSCGLNIAAKNGRFAFGWNQSPCRNMHSSRCIFRTLFAWFLFSFRVLYFAWHYITPINFKAVCIPQVIRPITDRAMRHSITMNLSFFISILSWPLAYYCRRLPFSNRNLRVTRCKTQRGGKKSE